MDINQFRKDKGGDPDKIKESQKRRYASTELVDEIIKLDEEWRVARFNLDQKNKEKSKLSKEVGMKKSKKEDASDLIAQTKVVDEELAQLEKAEKLAKETLDNKVGMIGNMVHQSVPVSKDEVDNITVVEWGECRKEPNLHTHDELLHMIDGFDPVRGSRVAGHRGYYLKDIGVALNQALINYALQFLHKNSYTLLQTPFLMRKETMTKVAQLSEFDEALYKVQGTTDDASDTSDYYLIATSEQPIAAFHIGEWIEPKSLPIKYAGYSTCFRKEAGSYGRDNWGIFRVHQFEKIEQFCITDPESSWEMHEAMRGLAEEFHQSLGIPYRVVNIVSGELNNAAAKKYDLEGWFPGLGTYRELVSASNCTDFQSRKLEIRYGSKKGDEREKKYVHMLNATLCATGRVICAILELGQTEKGINVPKALQPFMAPYLEDASFIPFKNECPKRVKPKEKKEKKAKETKEEKKTE